MKHVAWPKVVILSLRGKNRPNRIGCSIARMVKREDKTLVVAELDAIKGTPVLDINPSRELMRDYRAIGQGN